MQPETNGVKTWQWVVTVIVIIVLILLGYYMFKNKTPNMTDNVSNTDTTSPVSKDTNRVVVNDQFPGNIVYISTVQLAKPGFVVIRKDMNGVPGDIIGSQYSDKGINPVKVTLKTSTVEGGVYYAFIFDDTDGNKVFDATKDMPLKDAAGNAISKLFRATSSITEVKG